MHRVRNEKNVETAAKGEGTLWCANVGTAVIALPHGHSPHGAPVWAAPMVGGCVNREDGRRLQTSVGRVGGHGRWAGGSFQKDGVKCLRAQMFQKGLKDVHGPLHVIEAEAGARLPWTEHDRGTECTWGRKCGEAPGEEKGQAAASGAQGF